MPPMPLDAANGSGSCDGTATLPQCVIGTAVVDGLGNYVLDKIVAANGTIRALFARAACGGLSQRFNVATSGEARIRRVGSGQ